MEEIAKLWIELAEEDFKNIKIMQEARSPRAAVFFARQAVEKIIKAYITKIKVKEPKKTHRLETLIKDAGLNLEEIEKELPLQIEELSKAYIWVRYPDLSRRFYTNEEITKKLIVTAEKLYLWIKKKLEKK